MVSREQEIQQIHHQYRTFYEIGSGVLLVLLGVWVGSLLFRDGYAVNIYTDVLSVIVTIAVLDRLAEQREERRRIADLRDRLIREAGSVSNDRAIAALHEIRAYHWLVGQAGILQHQQLFDANLTGANLADANLEGTRIWNANLSHAELPSANLKDAILQFANLENANCRYIGCEGADFFSANFSGANLRGANFDGARLIRANFAGANLHLAYLVGANVQGAIFDTTTTLPDGTRWTPETDMMRFGAVHEFPREDA